VALDSQSRGPHQICECVYARIGGENNQSIARPANLCPKGDRRTPSLVSTSGHCHLGDSIDCHFWPIFPTQSRVMMLELLASYVLFPSVGRKNMPDADARTRTAQYPEVADDHGEARELKKVLSLSLPPEWCSGRQWQRIRHRGGPEPAWPRIMLPSRRSRIGTPALNRGFFVSGVSVMTCLPSRYTAGDRRCWLFISSVQSRPLPHWHACSTRGRNARGHP
jgi:hypothetical protein